MAVGTVPKSGMACRRYVGDMLAWVHQTVASEKELLLSLLRPQDAQQDAGPVEQEALEIEGINLFILLDKVWILCDPPVSHDECIST